MDLSPLQQQATELRTEIDDLRRQIAADKPEVGELDRVEAQCRVFAEAADLLVAAAAKDHVLLLRKVTKLALDQARLYRQLRRTVEEIRQMRAGPQQRRRYDELARRSKRLLHERPFEAALDELIDEAS